ncbi:MAG: hypothetical protein EA408_06240 [Marinilabiliales bacterium]|nr:MAG: hypothetical protein EA408_06240 [Marinilabiliales bacterium]
MSLTIGIKNTAIIIVVIIFQFIQPLSGQAVLPGILETGTLPEQLDYIEDRTRIYNDFRAIREDMFQAIKRNSIDSLEGLKGEIEELTSDLVDRIENIDSLTVLLANTREELSLAVRNRDSIAFLGIPMSKTTYNLIVWFIIAGLLALLVLGSLAFFRNRVVTLRVQEDLEELKEEFDSYRNSSREQREKLVLDHFNEIKRLKAGR